MSDDLKKLVEGGPIIRAKAGAIAFPYAAAGAAFTLWFNGQVRRLPNFRLMLGTEAARVVSLHEDGRMECEVETEALEPERRFVEFDASHLDQLVSKLASLSSEAKQAGESVERLRRERVDADAAESAKRGTDSILRDLFEDRHD